LLKLIQELYVPSYQSLAAEAVWSSGQRVGLYILNFTTLIPALDLQHTKHERYPPDHRRRDQLWFESDRFQG
jgi:hypothetical protein